MEFPKTVTNRPFTINVVSCLIALQNENLTCSQLPCLKCGMKCLLRKYKLYFVITDNSVATQIFRK